MNARMQADRESGAPDERGDKRAADAHAARRRVLKAALAASPVILTLKSGPARAESAGMSMMPGYGGAEEDDDDD